MVEHRRHSRESAPLVIVRSLKSQCLLSPALDLYFDGLIRGIELLLCLIIYKLEPGKRTGVAITQLLIEYLLILQKRILRLKVVLFSAIVQRDCGIYSAPLCQSHWQQDRCRGYEKLVHLLELLI